MTNEPLPVLETKQYLSRIPGRRPMDKLHKNVGHAKSAVNNYFNGYDSYGDHYNPRIAKFNAEKNWSHTGSEMEIYEMTENGWKLLYEIKPGDEELPWKKGELQAFRDKFNTDLMSKRDKLDAHIKNLAIESYKSALRSGYTYRDADMGYYKGYEDGFRAAKAQYDTSGE